MARPMGPKKQAAIEQVRLMREQGQNDEDIRQALILIGLTKAQVNELIPYPVEPPKPIQPVTADTRSAVMEGCIHFLETIAKRIHPNAVDRFPDLGPLKGDALTWARKVRGVL